VTSTVKMTSPERPNKTSRTAREQQAPQGDRTLQYGGRGPQGSRSGPATQQTVEEPQCSGDNPPGQQTRRKPESSKRGLTQSYGGQESQASGSGLFAQQTGRHPQASGRRPAQSDGGRNLQASGINSTQQQTGRASLAIIEGHSPQQQIARASEQKADLVIRGPHMRPSGLPQHAAGLAGGKAGEPTHKTQAPGSSSSYQAAGSAAGWKGSPARDARAARSDSPQHAAGLAEGRKGSPARGTQAPEGSLPHQAASSAAGRKGSPAQNMRAAEGSSPQQAADLASGRESAPTRAPQSLQSTLSQMITKSSLGRVQQSVSSARACGQKFELDSRPTIAPQRIDDLKCHQPEDPMDKTVGELMQERDAGIFKHLMSMTTALFLAPRSPTPQQQSATAFENFLVTRYNEEVAAPHGLPTMVCQVYQEREHHWVLGKEDEDVHNVEEDAIPPGPQCEPIPKLKYRLTNKMFK
jgi:hypothetical protein